MIVQDEKPEKIFYSMGEVAEMFDVKPSLIRFWEQKFDILKPKKNKKGNRLFSPADLHNMKMIYHLVKERGMTLDGADKYMKASRHTIERNMELSEKLHSIRSLLEEVRNALGTDGGVLEETFEEPTPAMPPEVTVKPVEEYAQVGVVETAEEYASVGVAETAETVLIPADEDAEALMMEAIAFMDKEQEVEEMADFETETDKEEKTEKETKFEEPQKPYFVEQTLFDF